MLDTRQTEFRICWSTWGQETNINTIAYRSVCRYWYSAYHATTVLPIVGVTSTKIRTMVLSLECRLLVAVAAVLLLLVLLLLVD